MQARVMLCSALHCMYSIARDSLCVVILSSFIKVLSKCIYGVSFIIKCYDSTFSIFAMIAHT